jgi:hypothetical protein
MTLGGFVVYESQKTLLEALEAAAKATGTDW